MKLVHILSISLLLASCQKFVDTPLPSNAIVPESVFQKDATAISALQGAYWSVQNCSIELAMSTDLFSDEVFNPTAGGLTLESQENTYSVNSNFQFFDNYYKAIFVANSMLEGVDRPNGLTAATIKQIKGESLFLRAFCHFQLANLYGNPPLVTTTVVSVSAYLGNTPRQKIYTSVIKDLESAYELVGTDYPSADRARANKAVVSALLAKAYLFNKQWKDAETAATRQITNTAYNLPDDLNSIFLNTSTETIWQLWTQSGVTTQASTYIPYSTTDVFYMLRPATAQAFEAGDKRRSTWVKEGTGNSAGRWYLTKYKRTSSTSGTAEYMIQLRLAEQYLIRAEARAQQDNIDGAMADVNAVRKRTGLLDASAANKTEALLKIEQEKRIELMTENGSRWFDLNRTGRSTAVIGAVKPTWQPRDTILPYATPLLLANRNLEPTPGY